MSWIKLHREIKKHWIWDDAVKFQRWVDILMSVNHSTQKINIGNDIYECKRGESIKSLQTWAKEWKTSKDTVRNFFNLLEKDGMITKENLTKTTRITVCNYDTYQTEIHDSLTQTKRIPNANQTQSYPNKNDKKEKNYKNEKKEYPYQEIPTLWNSICIDLPKIKILTATRRDKIKSRIDEMGCNTNEEILSIFTALFQKIQQSKFLTGENKNNWQASFDWVFTNGTNWIKINEGNYDDVKHENTTKNSLKLGVGEFINNNGIRTYGTGIAIIPDTAPPRPNDKYSWDSSSQNWIML